MRWSRLSFGERRWIGSGDGKIRTGSDVGYIPMRAEKHCPEIKNKK